MLLMAAPAELCVCEIGGAWEGVLQFATRSTDASENTLWKQEPAAFWWMVSPRLQARCQARPGDRHNNGVLCRQALTATNPWPAGTRCQHQASLHIHQC